MAAGIFEMFDQEQTDRIVSRVYEAAFGARVRLAKLAHEETRLGVWEHKVLKNVIATQLIYEEIRGERTVGVIAENQATGITEIAQPLGPILAMIPVTNPTSTVLFKTLIALKTRNPIIVNPHKNASASCREAARICYEAALEADAPEHCIQWVTAPSREMTHALMSHPGVALILATGGPSLVKAAYSSGTPAYGVGPGNVPVLVDESADLPFAVANIIISKTFDNGTICASEQAIVCQSGIASRLRREFADQGAYFMTPEETRRVAAVAVDPTTGQMTSVIIGQPVTAIASLAGISPPAGTTLLMATLDGVGPGFPLSGEVLAPILAFYQRDSFEEAIKLCIDLNFLQGLGHTASIFANDEARIRRYCTLMNAGRIVVNAPSAQGAVGGSFTRLNVSFTLGCGTWGKNITTENVTARHLLNIKRVCRRRGNDKWLTFPKERYLDESMSAGDCTREYHKNS